MALYRIKEDTPIGRIDFERCCQRLTSNQLAAVRSMIESLVETRQGDFRAKDLLKYGAWEKSPLQELRDVGCLSDRVKASQCYGFFVREAMQKHPARWVLQRCEADPKSGALYSRLPDPC